MAAIPGSIETDQQPPMTVPLRHFVVGLGFLLAGVAIGFGVAEGAVTGLGRLAHVHVLLAGWICITIMGAMTQFVPVWSGTQLHSRRLATVQLVLVATGLAGFATALILSVVSFLPVFGVLMLAGFWTFAYNIARTLVTVETWGVTERHFALALGFFLLLTVLGLVLATDLSRSILAGSGITHVQLLEAHATLAVFGAVLTTVYGALYQLGTMFTQTELHGIDGPLRSIEELGHPTGVVLLAVGRLLDGVLLAQIGGALVVVAALAFCTILARKLWEMQVDWTPMHTRYAVVVPMLTAWALLTAPAWLDDPTRYDRLFGAPGVRHLLLIGGIGFVVFGTLYHIVPFVVWVHRYSDRLGYEAVPMIDDLYDDRLAALDGAFLIGGTVALVAADLLVAPAAVRSVGGILVGLGVLVFGTNVSLVLRDHSPYTFDRLLLGSLSPRRSNDEPATTEQNRPSAPDR
ncbi:MAG: hypothetical protein ABEI57_08440 [Halapricum sp.]